MKRNGGWRGFTLVELLAVISILALLAALLMPTINRGREKARSIQCASNLKQLHTAAMQYMMVMVRNDYRLPYAASCETFDNGSWGKEFTGWVDWRRDPSATDPVGDKVTYWTNGLTALNSYGRTCITNGALYGYTRSEKIYLCPTFSKLYARFNPARSYGLNTAVGGLPYHSMQGGSRIVLFADQAISNTEIFVSGRTTARITTLYGLSTVPVTNDPSTVTSCRRYSKNTDGALDCGVDSAGKTNEYMGAIHESKANAVFVDGHVEKIGPTSSVAVCSGNWGDT